MARATLTLSAQEGNERACRASRLILRHNYVTRVENLEYHLVFHNVFEDLEEWGAGERSELLDHVEATAAAIELGEDVVVLKHPEVR